MDRESVLRWVAGYERVWRANDVDAVESLFTEKAVLGVGLFAGRRLRSGYLHGCQLHVLVDRDGGFRADPINYAVNVAVQHHVAHHQYAGTAEQVQCLDQLAQLGLVHGDAVPR